MQLHNLKRNKANRKAKQVGRGGTRGKTSGRGTKGQNARSGRKKRPEMRDIIKKLPKLRGRGKNFLKSRFADAMPINLSAIESNFSAGDLVNAKSLLEKKIIKLRNGKIPRIKILAGRKLSKSLTFEGVEISKSAREAVEAVRGQVK